MMNDDQKPYSIDFDSQKRSRLADNVYDSFYESIISGKFKQGEWLRQIQLSEAMNVSHSTIREALSKLVAEGLAEQVPRRGVRVRSIPKEDLSDIYELRILAEGLAWEAAVAYITEAEIEEMRKLLPMTGADLENRRVQEFRQANQVFHMIPIRASRRRYLIKVISQLLGLNNYYLLLQKKPAEVRIQDGKINFEEHRQLIDALEQRNGELTRRLIENHIRRSMKDRLDLYTSNSNSGG